jgi:hypothetical protein
MTSSRLMLEIDIDVGRLLALRGDEAGEQKVMLGRVHRGDAKHVADGGVGRRATSLAQNALVLRDPHDLVDGEKVGRVIKLSMSASSSFKSRDLLRHAGVVIAVRGVAPDQLFQPVLRRSSGRHGLIGVGVGKLIEREIDASQNGFAFRPAHPAHP